MFNSRGKHTKVVHATSVVVNNEDTEQHLSYNSWKRQNKINPQATKIATVNPKLNKAMQETNNERPGQSQ